MKTVATKTTAFGAGVFAVLGMSLFDAVSADWHVSGHAETASVLLMYAVAWIAPVVLYVYGFDRRNWGRPFVPEAEWRAFAIRVGCWYVGWFLGGYAIGFLS